MQIYITTVLNGQHVAAVRIAIRRCGAPIALIWVTPGDCRNVGIHCALRERYRSAGVDAHRRIGVRSGAIAVTVMAARHRSLAGWLRSAQAQIVGGRLLRIAVVSCAGFVVIVVVAIEVVVVERQRHRLYETHCLWLVGKKRRICSGLIMLAKTVLFRVRPSFIFHITITFGILSGQYMRNINTSLCPFVYSSSFVCAVCTARDVFSVCSGIYYGNVCQPGVLVCVCVPLRWSRISICRSAFTEEWYNTVFFMQPYYVSSQRECRTTHISCNFCHRVEFSILYCKKRIYYTENIFHAIASTYDASHSMPPDLYAALFCTFAPSDTQNPFRTSAFIYT